jgi:iron complex outermembrane receptor protein
MSQHKIAGRRRRKRERNILEKQLLLASAAAGVLLSGSVAHAQLSKSAGAETGGTTPQKDAQVSEVIVTAQKRSEKLSTVPLSITAITPTLLNSSASKNLEELQGIVPGVTFPAASSYGGAPIVIRGVSGQGAFLEDDPVAVYVDGVYQPSNSRFGVSDLTDVESVEIVRGPQGTLQGRNATAGAILVHTTDPGQTFTGFLRASIADPFEYRAEGAVTIPLADTLSVRLSGDYFYQRGFGENTFDARHIGGETAENVRAVVLWRPTSRFSARLSVNYQDLSSTQASARWAYTQVNPTGQAVTNATPYVSLPTGLQNQYLNNDFDLNIRSNNTQRSPNGALEVHYDLGPVELISLTGLSSAKNDGTADSDGLGLTGTNGVSLIDADTGNLRQAYNEGHIKGHQFTEEVRFQSTGDTRFKWILGGYASRAVDSFIFNIFNLEETVPTDEIVGFTAHQVDISYAGFADGTFKVTDKLALTGGVRYTTENKLFRNTFSLTNFDSGFQFFELPYNPPKTTWDDVSYRGNINYQATSDLLVYASYSRGFKSGGFNAFGVGPQPSFSPETLTSIELGVKSYFWDRRAYVAASGYSNKYNNLQVTVGVPTGGQIIENAASANIDGFEIEGQLKPVEHLSLTGNVSYTDATYSNFQNAGAVDGSLVDATGNQLPNTPKWQYYIQGDYDFGLGEGWSANFDLNWRWRDKVYFFGTNETPDLEGQPDGELGARIDLIDHADAFTVSLYGRNLNNRRVVASEQVQFAYPVAFFNEPRVVGLQLQKKF